jgi:hypothetical protein
LGVFGRFSLRKRFLQAISKQAAAPLAITPNPLQRIWIEVAADFESLLSRQIADSALGLTFMFWNQNNESNAAGESERRSIIEHSGVVYSVPKQSGYNARHQFQ